MSNEPMTNDEYWAHLHDARANALFMTQGALLVVLEYMEAGDYASAHAGLKRAITYGEGLPFGGLAVIPNGETHPPTSPKTSSGERSEFPRSAN